MGRVRSGLGYGEGLGGAVQTLDHMPPHTGVRVTLDLLILLAICPPSAAIAHANPHKGAKLLLFFVFVLDGT